MLEEVLEAKPFTADTKNLLLSMLYKIETSYNDYEKVKRNVLDRNDFIEQIIGTIKYCCEDIMLVEPKSKIAQSMNGKIAQVNGNKIIALPTEYALITAIAQQIPKDFIIESILSDELKKVLDIGYVSNIVEEICNFDGWTWNISSISEYALLYQNIEILVGNDFMEQWKIGKKNIKKIKDIIFEFYNGESELLLFQELKRVLARGFVIDFPEKTNEYIKRVKKLKKEFRKIDNTSSYIAEVTEIKKELNDKVGEIDEILLNPSLMKRKYIEENNSRPLEKKIFSMRHYEKLLKNDKEGLIAQLIECNKLLDPSSMIERKQKLKSQIDEYEDIEEALREEKSFKELVIDFQRTFLETLKVKVERANTKKELVDLIYILRYYKNIKLDSYIKDIPEIKKHIDVFERQLLLKAINSEVFCKLTENSLYAVDIVNEILDTNIMDLEKINIVPKVKNSMIILEIYDGEVLDRTINLNPDIKVIELKQNKRSKLFE